VYAGGDDVLALLSLKHVLACADEIRQSFYHTMQGFVFKDKDGNTKSPTMSAGIAITPADFPLDRAIELARKAEKSAKENYGRDAVVFTEAHGSGQLRSAGAKWDEVIVLMDNTIDLFQRDALSGKIAYELLDINHDMGGQHLKQAREAELKRLLGRRIGEKASKEDKHNIQNGFATQIATFAESHSWADVANWLILARFLASNGKRGGS
jgi:CRISPR-associated protein Cmr2